MKYFIFFSIITLVVLIACKLVPTDYIISELDPPPPPEPVESDTCITPIEYTSPAFVNGYMEITDVLQTDMTLIVGNQSVTVSQAEWPQVDSILKSMFETVYPQYSFHVYTADYDIRRMTVIVDSTNNRQQFYLKAQIQYNGVKHYWGWTTQTYFFFDALTFDEHVAVATAYKSVNKFSFIRTTMDSSQCDYVARRIRDVCKEGREWADFTHGGPWDPALVQSFDSTGWEQVSTFGSPDIIATRVLITPADDVSRISVLADTWKWQDKGYQVVVIPSYL